MIKQTIAAIIIASPASALTLEWTMTPGATGNTWQTEAGTFTLSEYDYVNQLFTIEYERDQYVPGLRVGAWWHLADDDGNEIDSGDVFDWGGCAISGGLAMREGRVASWDLCGEGHSIVTQREEPSPVPLPHALALLALGLASIWKVKQ